MPEELICPRCGAANPAGSEFCANCGWAPPSPAPPPQGRFRRGSALSGRSQRISPFALVAGVLGVALVVALAVVVVLHFFGGTTDSGSGPAAPPQSASPSASPTGSPTSGGKPSISTPTPLPGAPPPDYQRLADQVSSGILKVVASGCQDIGSRVGSAFLISSDTAVASYGSLAGAKVIAVTDGTKTVPATITGADAAHGVVLLRLDRPVGGHVFTVDAVAPKQGDSIGAFGVKISGSRPELTQAKISDTGTQTLIGSTTVTGLASTDTTADGGTSGGPTVAADGHADGMVLIGAAGGTMMIIPGQAISAAIKNSPALPAANCSGVVGPDATVIGGSADKPVQATLQEYFGGINSADYSSAYQRLTQAARGGKTYQQHVEGWTTSYDFNILVHNASGSSAHVTFDSIFEKGRGPSGSATCARWDIDYQFVDSSSGLLINSATPHAGSIWTAC